MVLCEVFLGSFKRGFKACFEEHVTQCGTKEKIRVLWRKYVNSRTFQQGQWDSVHVCACVCMSFIVHSGAAKSLNVPKCRFSCNCKSIRLSSSTQPIMLHFYG